MNPPLIAFLFIFFTSSSYGQDNEQYLECFRSVFNCGDTIQDITYPFWGDARPRYCGLEEFELTCQNNEFATIDIDAQKFRVLDILKSNPSMRIARDDLLNDVCPQEFSNTTLDHTPFAYIPAYYENLTLFYDCADEIIKTTSARNTFNCSISGENRIRRRGFYAEDPFSPAEIQNVERCGINMTVPVIREAVKRFRVDYTMGVWELVNLGFLVEYRIENNRSCLACVAPGRLCWINGTSFEDYACLCPNGGVGPLVCSRNSSGATNCLACEASGGRCRSSSTSLENSACLCPNGGVVPLVCSTNSLSASKLNLRLKILIGTGGALSAVLSMCFLIFCVKKSSSTRSVAFWERETEIDKNVEAFIRQHGSSTPKRYKYSDVKKITNSFKEELGRGGYGNVYKGMLADGRLVAVKILNATKGNGEEFINEVASIGRTCHVNVVTLLGFCYEGKKRALIYEFMCNGSLEKCIYHISPQSNGQHLGWEKLYQIALGIARGLEYLHRGCNTRILHFDIKPHNILLDEDFCPKIADFGLAKRYHGKDSIVSMAEARGTIGYIAPEVCSRRGVSHKSDVYSYGMMLLEMVGGRRNVDAGVVHTSEIYFPHWIYNRLELNEDLQLRGVTHIQENEIARRMLIVGLWCIQTDTMHRPPMNKVIQMLEGSMEALQIPPKPFLSSPPRSPPVLLAEPPGLTKLKSTQNPRKSLSGISTNTWRAENQTKIKNF